MNYEKCVTCHMIFTPSLPVPNCHTFLDSLPPPCNVTYFMDVPEPPFVLGPANREHDIVCLKASPELEMWAVTFAMKWGQGAQHELSFPPRPASSFGFRDCFSLFTWVLACFLWDRRKCNTCFSLVIFRIFTVTLTAAAELTEFPKLEEGHVPQCPIGSDATGSFLERPCISFYLCFHLLISQSWSISNFNAYRKKSFTQS